jgi:hypothetical protein
MTPRLSAYRLNAIACELEYMPCNVDKLDGRIDTSFYTQMSETWQVEQDELLREIARHQAVDRSYLDLAHGAHRLFSKQEPHEPSTLMGMDPGVLKLADPPLARANGLRHRSLGGKRGPGDSPLSRPQPP